MLRVIYRYSKQRSRKGRYLLCIKRSKPSAKVRCHPSSLSTHLFLLFFFLRWPKWEGNMNRASNSETAKITMTTAGRGCQNFPVSPGIKSKGTKAIMVVTILKITGKETSLVPAMAACMGCLLYTSDAADDLLCVDLGGRRIIKKKKK